MAARNDEYQRRLIDLLESDRDYGQIAAELNSTPESIKVMACRWRKKLGEDRIPRRDFNRRPRGFQASREVPDLDDFCSDRYLRAANT